MIITYRLMGHTRDKTSVRLWDTADLAYIREQTKDFSPSGHFDAFCIYSFHALQASRKYEMDSAEVEMLNGMAVFHRKNISDDQLKSEMASLGLVTVIHIRNHGESLSHPLLHE